MIGSRGAREFDAVARAMRSARVTNIALIAGIALAWWMAIASASGATTRGCALNGARVIVSSDSARVLRRFGETFGCLYSSGRIVGLGAYRDSEFSTNYQRNIRLAGRYAALSQTTLGKGLLQYDVKVFDLRTGRPSSITETGNAPAEAQLQTDGSAFGIGPTTDIVLRATGDVAWIAKDVYTQGPARYEVRRRGRRRSVLLAEGTDVAPASLQLQGRTLSWRQAGRTRQATLGPAPS